jgi:hypothetical protein
MNLIESLAEQAKINIWSMVPSLVDELGETPDVLAKFKSSKFICASGGKCLPQLMFSSCSVTHLSSFTQAQSVPLAQEK